MPLLDSLAYKERSKISKEKTGIRMTYDEDGSPIIEAHKSSQITTLDELLDAAQVDKEQWEVEHHTANKWDQMSGDHGLVTLWQVKAKLRRRDLSPTNIRELIKEGWSSFRRGIDTKLPAAKVSKSAKGRMVEFALPDLHLGKQAWSDETGHGHWDNNIAKKVYEEALEDLIRRSPDAEEAWLVVGNDFFNVDSDARTTTGGTPQDEDGRWQKTFLIGKRLMMWAVGRLRRKYAKVKVIMVYGNHDRQRSFYLGEVLAEAFSKTNGVEIDNRPLHRKYYRWGKTGLGYTHGDRIKAKDLAFLCQNEARAIWGATSRFEMHLGHLHQDIVKTLGGVIVRWLPALCTPDAWHAAMGFTMAEKAAMALVYDPDGMTNQIVHYPRNELFL